MRAIKMIERGAREHARALTAKFRKAGRPTEYLDGETPDAERADILGRLWKFRLSEIDGWVEADGAAEPDKDEAVGKP